VARWIFRKVADGLRYLQNEMKIAHRDIKPDNILYMTEKGTGLLSPEDPDDKETDLVKIGDFTVALELTREEVRVNDKLGTPAFLAPEVHTQESYLVKPLDVWALGITLYVYLSGGSLPFLCENETLTAASIVKDEIDFEALKAEDGATKLSEECINFLKGVLHKDPSRRMSIEQVVIHTWLLP